MHSILCLILMQSGRSMKNINKSWIATGVTLHVVRALMTVLGCLLMMACGSVPVASDGPLIRPSEPTQDIQIERRSEDIICVTVDNETTCVPVVHDASITTDFFRTYALVDGASTKIKADK